MIEDILSKVVHDKTSNIHEYVFKDNDKISYPLKVIISQITDQASVRFNINHTIQLSSYIQINQTQLHSKQCKFTNLQNACKFQLLIPGMYKQYNANYKVHSHKFKIQSQF